MKQQIHMIVSTEDDAHYKKVDTVKEMQETIETIVKEYPRFDPEKDLTVIVGESRCIKSKLMGATIRYSLERCGCGC